MARHPRSAPGGLVYHVLNRAAGRQTLFRTDADFLAFERLIVEAHERHPLDVFAYCLMGNHWHFLVRPRADGDLSAFFRWLTLTHAMRWRVAHRTVGQGPLYQGRFKSFPVQEDRHFLLAARYVERNALTAGLVRRAEDWRWGSLWLRARRAAAEGAASDRDDATEAALRDVLLASPWPVPRPRDWVERVNTAITAKDVEHVRASLARGRPLGDGPWTARAVAKMGLEHTVRSEGRPRKSPARRGKV
jgi:putative transposase